MHDIDLGVDLPLLIPMGQATLPFRVSIFQYEGTFYAAQDSERDGYALKNNVLIFLFLLDAFKTCEK